MPLFLISVMGLASTVLCSVDHSSLRCVSTIDSHDVFVGYVSTSPPLKVVLLTKIYNNAS